MSWAGLVPFCGREGGTLSYALSQLLGVCWRSLGFLGVWKHQLSVYLRLHVAFYVCVLQIAPFS